MTREEHLLTCLAEECAEVAQRVSKALRFGLDEVQPGQDHSNAERIVHEFNDLAAVVNILSRAGVIPWADWSTAREEKKLAKIEHFMTISREQGVLS